MRAAPCAAWEISPPPETHTAPGILCWPRPGVQNSYTCSVSSCPQGSLVRRALPHAHSLGPCLSWAPCIPGCPRAGLRIPRGQRAPPPHLFKTYLSERPSWKDLLLSPQTAATGRLGRAAARGPGLHPGLPRGWQRPRHPPGALAGSWVGRESVLLWDPCLAGSSSPRSAGAALCCERRNRSAVWSCWFLQETLDWTELHSRTPPPPGPDPRGVTHPAVWLTAARPEVKTTPSTGEFPCANTARPLSCASALRPRPQPLLGSPSALQTTRGH